MLERNAENIIGPDWSVLLDQIFLESLGKFRKYDGRLVQDLLRVVRNKVRMQPQLMSSRLSLFFPLFDTSLESDMPSAFVRSETPLSGLTRECPGTCRQPTRRLPLVFYIPLP